jgi:hypothetical protein
VGKNNGSHFLNAFALKSPKICPRVGFGTFQGKTKLEPLFLGKPLPTEVGLFPAPVF